jgi:uncharacterized protein
MITHAVDWFEIPADDLQRAMRFYEGILAAKLKVEKIEGGEMAAFPASEQGVSGCIWKGTLPHSKPAAHGTLVYLNAAPSIDAVLARAQQAGAVVAMPKTALPPGMGYFAHIIDSEGNRVGLHALN